MWKNTNALGSEKIYEQHQPGQEHSLGSPAPQGGADPGNASYCKQSGGTSGECPQQVYENRPLRDLLMPENPFC